ncbi:hypothetical protein DFH07DRAFT_771600 [Mycena maculata]|uniref:Uncharacterized protein n=1 Tax=Mycena maculata TaxID=230809 RepID=A0AAD7NIE0_9AGAR|nr:hypothetical protein DFH07DRAFT_771600 [Mycena maculata]
MDAVPTIMQTAIKVQTDRYRSQASKTRDQMPKVLQLDWVVIQEQAAHNFTLACVRSNVGSRWQNPMSDVWPCIVLDDEVDRGDEDDEGNLDTEQQSAEAATNSANDQWLATTLEKVQKQIKIKDQPRERVQAELARHGHRPTEAIYTDNPRHLPEFKVSGPLIFASSPDRIDTLCDTIIQSLPTNNSTYIVLSIRLEADKITSIQLRESSSIYVFAVTAHIPLALKSVLTHPRIIKLGHKITSSAKHLSSAWGLSIPTSSLVDLGKLAKLKGAAADTSCSLPT